MSNKVAEITAAGKALIATTLPSYAELDYYIDIGKNSFNSKSTRYGFSPYEADFVEGRLLNYATLDHRFQLTLSTDYNNKDDDTKQRTAVEVLFKNSHLVLKEFVKDKIGAILVRGVNFEEPEYIEENTAIVRMNILVRYRYLVT